MVKFLQRLDDEIVYREPGWAAPVGVAAKEIRVRFAGRILDGMGCSPGPARIWLITVDVRNRANAKLGEEFRFVEHPR